MKAGQNGGLGYPSLVAMALEKEPTALYALYTDRFRQVCDTVCRIAGRSADSAVLVRDAFVLSFENLDRLKDPEAFPVWMESLAEHSAKAYLEKKKTSGSRAAGSFSMSAKSMDEIWKDVDRSLKGEPVRLSFAENIPWDPKDDIHWDLEEDFEAIDMLTAIGRSRARTRRLRIMVAAAVLFIMVPLVLLASNLDRFSKKTYEFPNVTKSLSDEMMIEFADAISGQLAGQIGEIYQIDENTYYLMIYLNDTVSGGALVNYSSERGTSLISAKEKLLSEDDLEKVAEDPYLGLYYSGAATKGEGGAIENAIAEAGGKDVELEDNELTVASDSIVEMLQGASDEKRRLEEILGVDENADFNVVLRIKCRNIDLSKPVTLSLDSSISDAIGEAGDLEIILGDYSHTISLTRQQLSQLCDVHGKITIVYTALSSRKYDISFLNADRKAIDELYGDVGITLPADSALTHVTANYGGRRENRGGVYDEAAGTISFTVERSGEYELIGNDAAVNDLAGLSEEESEAVRFMVSMMFLDTDIKGEFDPKGEITRGELAAAIGA
ncbi:MAG: hypothetical protein II689_02440, partial [Firmicutes bacterium]|nr:hypothetical protein [Bacillota bacterium]